MKNEKANNIKNRKNGNANNNKYNKYNKLLLKFNKPNNLIFT